MSQAAHGDLRIRLLGRFEVEVAGKVLRGESFARRRPVDLLKLLALAPQRALHREQVIDLLWPEKDLAAGANNLHRALYDLRQALGGTCVFADKGTVRLSAGAWVDVEAFQQAVEAGDAGSLASALALYRGELCPDDPYTDALAARREELRRRFVAAGLRRAELAVAAGEEEVAVEALQRLLSLEPAQEEGHRFLMSLLARLGRRREALQQFALCTKALREAVDDAPSAQTMALRDAILRGDASLIPRREAVGWARVARRILGSAAPQPCSPLRRRQTRRASTIDWAARIRSPSSSTISSSGCW